MPTTCKIEFENNPRKIVYAGQLLRGNAHIAFNVQKTVHGIYIRLCGTAYVQWKQGKSLYTGNETYLDDLKYFVGSNTGEVLLPPGSYDYSFEFKLPANIPSSIEFKCGRISYQAQVVFDMPKWADKKFHETFIVLNAINLNDTLSLRECVSAQKEESIYPFFMMCSKNEPVRISASLPVGGFAMGQVINIQININNRTEQPFHRFIAELIKEVTFYRHENSKHDREEKSIINKKAVQGCGANQVKKIFLNIDVPSTTPSDLIHSKICKIRYYLRIIGVTPLFFNNIKLILPVTVGTYNVVTGKAPWDGLYYGGEYSQITHE